MNSEQWRTVEFHFNTLHDLSAADRRAALAGIEDEEVRLEVDSLLRHTGRDEDISRAIGIVPFGVNIDLREKRIGHYRLVRRLGQGGQGAVFEAVRDDGTFDQRVALKIVKWEIDSDAARTRFRQERQLLAGLDHPYIARLLDGGETDDGAPYLVMEYVDGVPLSAATDGWPLRRKLELFLKVADAVASAHRNLIVHRDLKPANILVTKDGSPKLLDFGVAKLMDSGGTHTVTGALPLTPDYASPEQVRGDPITTASDVYSLGVVLYEMLTGRKPYRIEKASATELERVICVEPPSPPGLGDELDQIVLMAMRKEPARRYRGVQPFAEDIQRYMEHRPVVARPDTLRYRASKFVRRNWWQSAAAASVMVSLGAGLAFSVRAERRANERFNEVRQIAGRMLFDIDAQLANTPGTLKAREQLVSTALRYLDSLRRDAAGDQSLRRELAVAYGKVAAAQGSVTAPSLGRPRDAVVSLEDALKLARPPRDAAGAEILSGLLCDASVTYRFLRDYPTALERAREAVGISAGLPHVARERALGEVAATLNQTGDLDGSLTTLDQTLAIARDNARRDSSWASRRELAALLDNIALARHRLTRFAEAMAAAGEALDIFRTAASQGLDDPRIARGISLSLRLIGDVQAGFERPGLGRFDDATRTYRDALKQIETLIRADPDDLNSRSEAGLLQIRLAYSIGAVDPRGGLSHAEQTIQLMDGAVPVATPYRPLARIAAARLLTELGLIPAAERYLREASQQVRPEDANTRADLSQAWARLEAARGNTEAAARWFDRAVGEYENLLLRTTTPFYAWNVANALELAGEAMPASAPLRRARILAVWQEQNRRFPGEPYIEQKVAEAQKEFKVR